MKDKKIDREKYEEGEKVARMRVEATVIMLLKGGACVCVCVCVSLTVCVCVRVCVCRAVRRAAGLSKLCR